MNRSTLNLMRSKEKEIIMKSGIELIAIERQEQIEKHGRTIIADVAYNSNPTGYMDIMPLTLQVIRLLDIGMRHEVPHFDKKIIYKMEAKEYKEKLVIAGALIAAEIDRLQNIKK